jgi:hypothetical protein
MLVTIDIPPYTAGTGLTYEWVGDYRLQVSLDEGAVCITANRDGLISLAGHLLNMAQEAVPGGCHLHLDEHNSLKAGSLELIVIRT